MNVLVNRVQRKVRLMAKDKQDDSLSIIVARIFAVFGILVVLWSQTWAGTWKVPAYWNEPTDSTRLTFYKNGSSSMTAKRTTPVNYDTTFTVNDDTFYTAEFKIYYAGLTDPATWVWERQTVPSAAVSAIAISDTLLNLLGDGAVNLVVNPGFERVDGGVLHGWQTITGNVNRSTIAAKSGRYGLVLRGDGVNSGVVEADSFYLETGNVVLVGIKWRDVASASGDLNIYNSAGSAIGTMTLSNPDKWYSQFVIMRNSGSAGVFRLRISTNGTGANDSVRVDDVFVGISPLGDNTIRTETFVSNAIGASDIAADAIGASELATDAAQEIATHAKDSVWKSLLANNDDVAGSFGDSAQAWAATAASSFDPDVDSVMVDVSVAIEGLVISIVDSVWESLMSARDGVAGSFGDSARFWGRGSNFNNLTDSVMVDVSVALNVLIPRIVDSVWESILADRDDVVGSFGDSAGWWGRGSNFDPLVDSVMVDVSVALNVLIPRMVDSVWESRFIDRDNIVGSFGDSAQGWGATGAGGGGSCLGTGSDTVRIFAIDTSGTDIAVEHVHITIRNAAGGEVISGYTEGNGSVRFVLDTASGVNRYNIYGNLPFYVFPNDTFSVLGAIDSMAHEGYDVSPTPIVVPSKSAGVSVLVVDNSGFPLPGIQVSAYLTGNNLSDSLGQGIENTPQYETTDSNGSVTFICIWSSYILPPTKWRFTIMSSGGKRKDYFVPRQEYDTLNFNTSQ